MLQIARKSLESAVKCISNDQPQVETISPELKKKRRICNVKNTWKTKRVYRANGFRYPLHKLVSEMAVSAATDDPRFNQIEPSELNDLEIDISVLSPLQMVETPLDFKLGRHGIYVKKALQPDASCLKLLLRPDGPKKNFYPNAAVQRPACHRMHGRRKT